MLNSIINTVTHPSIAEASGIDGNVEREVMVYTVNNDDFTNYIYGLYACVRPMGPP